MSTEEPRTGAAENLPSGAPESKPDPNLGDELRELGKQIEALIRTARESSRGKEIEQQVISAWKDVERGVEAAIAKAQSAEPAAAVKSTAASAADDLQLTMAHGLRGLNERLSRFIKETEEKRKKREQERGGTLAPVPHDDVVADRFGENPPVFGKGLAVPPAPVQVTHDPDAVAPVLPPEQGGTAETIVDDRFGGKPISFGKPPKEEPKS